MSSDLMLVVKVKGFVSTYVLFNLYMASVGQQFEYPAWFTVGVVLETKAF